MIPRLLVLVWRHDGIQAVFQLRPQATDKTFR